MHIGLHIGKFSWSGSPKNLGEKLGEIGKTSDENGFYSIWVMDHLFQLGTQYGTIHGLVEGPMLEAFTTLSYLSALTKHIKIGPMVTCSFFRNPGLLVKMISTIDVLSGGRMYFGIGAGWFQREAQGLGFQFPSLKDRYGRLEETLQVARHMWRGDTSPFKGRYHNLEEPINNPQPLNKPHPPIMIGGSGEKKTLRLVAEYGDACNIVIGTTLREAGRLHTDKDESLRKVERKFKVLKEHCKHIGRPYNEIEKTVTTYIKLAPGDMDSTEVLTLCKQLHDIGTQHIIFNMPNVHEIEPLEIIGREIIPEVADLA